MQRTIVLAVALVCCASAVSIKWTGYGQDGQWSNKINWSPDQVPTINDDVTIDQGIVTVAVPAGANSVTMGTSFEGPANLTINFAFMIGNGGLNVMGNGFVFINSGDANVQGTVNMGGTLYFQSGTIGGQWTISNRGAADLSGAAQKNFVGCGFAAGGSLIGSGVFTLNASSTITVTTAITLSGSVSIQNGDGTQVLFDTSKGTLTYTGGGTFQIMAPMSIGKFNFVGGNITIYTQLTFYNNLAIPAGSYVDTVGTAAVTLSGGVTGSGVLSGAGSLLAITNASFSGDINVVGGNVSIAGTVNVFTISGGIAKITSALTVTQLNLLNGNVQGSGINAKTGYLNSQGFNLNNDLSFTGQFSTGSGSLIAFGAAGSLYIQSTASLSVAGSLTLTGVPGRTVTNNGIIAVTNPITFQNINLGGSGNLTVSSTFYISTATFSQSNVKLSGSGIFKGATASITNLNAVSAAAGISATIGSYKFTCPTECDNISTSQTPSSPFQFVVA